MFIPVVCLYPLFNSASELQAYAITWFYQTFGHYSVASGNAKWT